MCGTYTIEDDLCDNCRPLTEVRGNELDDSNGSDEGMQDECSMECSDCGHFTICYRDFYGNWICGCKHND